MQTIIDHVTKKAFEIRTEGVKRDWLHPFLPFHFREGFLCHGEDVRIQITGIVLLSIQLNSVFSINGNIGVRIHTNEHNPCGERIRI